MSYILQMVPTFATLAHLRRAVVFNASYEVISCLATMIKCQPESLLHVAAYHCNAEVVTFLLDNKLVYVG